ncbi:MULTISPECIES: MFS transporter [unclassified Streptomyces]|uniref:MFS transporter n=1 Tax=unclassified Streptomyces TaxID=2593676 RepID=UPI000DBAB325|nr:MFS transporter [Streptomyces sp. SID8366]MYU63778.1 MFS transporter [Streptomyces sp. SID69]RAJ55657.1 transmembrane secretion effector [Streptomyces sp. PsTaAH-130]
MATTLAGAGPRLWAPARQRPFRLLWLGQSLSLLGDGFSVVAFSWITLGLTGSTLTLGYVLAFQAVPRALLTLVGGTLSDSWSTRTLMIASSWTRAVLMAGVGLAGLTGHLTVWMLCAAAAAFGAVDAFFQPARVSILPSVVDKDLLTPANALLGAGSRTAAVLGPAVGGVVIALTRAPVAFVVDAVCFALCGWCVSLIAARPRPTAAPKEDAKPADDKGVERPPSLGARIREGVVFTLRDPRLRTVVVLDTAVNFCYAGPFTVGFATLAEQVLRGGSATLGVLNGSLAGGAMLGTLAGGAMGGRPRVGLLVAALAGWLGAGMAVLGLVHSTPAIVVTVLAMGFAIGFQGVFGLSWIQRNIPQEVLSRVISVDMVLGYAAAPLSLIVCGALARTSTLALFGVVAAVLALTGLAVLGSRAVREMR